MENTQQLGATNQTISNIEDVQSIATYQTNLFLGIYLCLTHCPGRFCRWVVQCFNACMRQHKRVEPEQLVKIWDHSGLSYGICIAIFDTGCPENFILRSVVKRLRLATTPTSRVTFELFGNHK